MSSSRKRPRVRSIACEATEHDCKRSVDADTNIRNNTNDSKARGLHREPGHSDDPEAAAKTDISIDDEISIVTPHTKRLLKLLEEGTASHAEMAAQLLQEMAERASPLVLWDLLGRLFSLLLRNTWTCRQHAQWAMLGVAKSLPTSDQREFLLHSIPTTSNSATSVSSQDDEYLWLTVRDLDVQVVLRRGRLLLSEPEQGYQQREQGDDQDLIRFDERGSQSNDFLQRRIHLQRRILAKRLGLNSLAHATGNITEWLPDTITAGDFIASSGHPYLEKVRNEGDFVCDKNTNIDKSLRALLVMEIKQHDPSFLISHRNPQSLLATELLYRMFDPHWYVRHGALLGISSLLQAWKLNQGKAFGAWPQDILARCLCVLALDRFADFATETATAPVRLAASQVIALLYNMAPDHVRQACRGVLITLATHNGSWEVRYGGLLAMQFVTVVAKGLLDFTTVAVDALEDVCDDVVAAAAQMLLVASQMQIAFPSCVDFAGNALLRVDSYVSSSAVSLVRLFANELRRHQHLPANHARVWDCLLRFLDFPSSTIQISTLQAISSMLRHVETPTSLPSQNTYSVLVFRVFELFSEDNMCIENTRTLSQLCNACHGAWTALVAHAPKDLGLGKDLAVGIMLRLTALNREHTAMNQPYLLSELRVSCRVAAELLAKMTDSIVPFLVVCILGLLSSPWIRHYEIASFLYRSLSKEIGALVGACRSTLQDQLLTTPLCVLLQQCKYDDRAGIVCWEALSALVEFRSCNGENMLVVIEDFKRTIEKAYHQLTKGSIRKVISFAGMRVSAVVAGSLVSNGPLHLPQPLTPLIRALMTSLQSDTDSDRIELSSADLVALLTLLPSQHKNQIRDKILENICNMMMHNNSPPSTEAAECVVKGLIRDLRDEDTLQNLSPIWNRIRSLESSSLATLNSSSLLEILKMINTIGDAVVAGSKTARHLIATTIQPLILISCMSIEPECRSVAAICVKALAKADSVFTLDKAIPLLAGHVGETTSDSIRLGSCKLLHGIIEVVDIKVCPFVRYLLPISMSLMTDPVSECAKEASKMFAVLVRVAPLVREVASVAWSLDMDDHATLLMDHLIHGKPLPSCVLPPAVEKEMDLSGIALRCYQAEGVAWLRFLQTVGLHGALCDSMGLGKTLQALVAIVLAHENAKESGKTPISLVVCPTSVCGHWISEIHKFFPTLLNVTALIGNAKSREKSWNDREPGTNIIVTSYSVLRSDQERLRTNSWEYCILDEGHLLRNPKTATARAARAIRSRHRLILTGTPVQNRISELWATLDFLMPNFLGSHASFSKNYANPIRKGQHPAASADATKLSMDKLRLLHQQVLPFILRRDKETVFKELPPKIITDIPCSMTNEQQILYNSFCQGPNVQHSMTTLQSLLASADDTRQKLGPNVLKSLLYLRLLCTHPILVKPKAGTCVASTQLEMSGKLQALNELLRTAGVVQEELMGADNDTSAYYVDSEDAVEEQDDFLSSLQDHTDLSLTSCRIDHSVSGTKCLIFAQFVHSIDVVEKYLFQTHMPSLRYLRLDGRVPNERRAEIVDAFNKDASIQVLLLTTRVGGLGLNLTGASMVVILEHDFNPFADLQAMDRAHRIGQTKTVNVYRLITAGTIEEKIMALQKAKVQMSNAIVNTDNSSMYSMGTDRLLDIFTFRSDETNNLSCENRNKLSHLEDLDDQEEEYHSLSVEEFVKGFSAPSTKSTRSALKKMQLKEDGRDD